MIYKKLKLKDISNKIQTNATLTMYIPDNYDEFSKGRKRKSLIILPGGGYEFLSDREAEPIALRFLGEDIATFILSYTVGDFSLPTPIDEVLTSILYLKRNADELNLDKNHIGLIGFSAGGHLASVTALSTFDKEFHQLLETNYDELKISALVLGYPVVSLVNNTHEGTSNYFTKSNPALKEKYSTELHINKDYPSTFIWLTANDDDVHASNSLNLANALVKENIPVELHMYPKGPHGLSLANENTSTIFPEKEYVIPQSWVEHCLNFLKIYL